MTNGYPYWAFCNDRWLTGKVSSFDLDGQGLYLQFCMSAWAAHGAFNVCPTSIALRFRKDGAWVDATIKAMLAVGILTREGEQYRIKFIDDQLADLDALRAKRSKAGRASAESKHNTEVKNTIEEKSTVLPSVQQVLNTCSVEPVISAPAPAKPKKQKAASIEYSLDFETFWTAYPTCQRKTGKVEAWRSWQKMEGVRPPMDKLLEALESQKRMNAWTKDNGEFIPAPTAWLNQGRWQVVGNFKAEPRKAAMLPEGVRMEIARVFSDGRDRDAFLSQRSGIERAVIEAGSKDIDKDVDDVLWKGKTLIEKRDAVTA